MKPELTKPRVWGAFCVAVAADGLQWLLGPLGVLPFDEFIDVIAMVLVVALIGFHPLLLPTFVIEVVPVADLLPTWTGCVWLVVTLRRRREAEERSQATVPPPLHQAASPPPRQPPPPDVIDV